MPQPKRDAVHRYFLYDPSNNTSKCNLCGNLLKGKHTTNLKNHMSVKHSEEYLVITNINKENIQHRPSTSRDISTSDKIKINCVKLVTIHGRPFKLIQDKAFQDIINIAVPSNAQTKQINKNSVKAMIPEKAYQIKLLIASEVRNILISLKLDSATYLDRNFLGINLQYIKEGKIKIRYLAVLEVLERQTGDFLKDKVLEVLDDFNISTAQIYSITTDNGSNFKKMTKLLTEHCSTTADEIINVDNHNDSDDENEGDAEDDHNEQYSSSDIPSNLNIDSLVNSMNSVSFKPRAMLCAAHTLQLVVKDAIASNIDVLMCLEQTRKAVKILRRPNMKNIIKLSNLNKPIIDCPTRWTSTYQMLVRILLLKDICESHSEVSSVFSDNFWEQVTDLVTCFKPINDATLALQREQLTISDFYMEWLKCKAEVESIRISFANELAQFMKTRESDLLQSDLVLENLYLDGRLNVVLSDEECAKAQMSICETFRQIQKLTSESDTNVQTPDVASSSQHDTEHLSDISGLERMLRETEARRGLPTSRFSINSFEGMLVKLRYEPRIPLQENILTHWSNRGPNNPLKIVANCVLAAPATQVSVERLFSSVKYILNPLRSNISGSLLQDIMLIRSNHDLFD